MKALFFAVIAALALVGCGGHTDKPDYIFLPALPTDVPVPTATPTPTPTSTPSPTPSPTPTPEPTDAPVDEGKLLPDFR